MPSDKDRLPEVISKAIDLDVITSDPDILHTHQKMGEVEIYFLYNAGQEGKRISADLRASGEPEVWNAFTGEATPLHRFESRDGRTTIRLDIGPNEGASVILRPPRGGPSVLEDNLSGIASVESSNEGIRVRGSCDAGGTKSLRLVHRGREYVSELTCDDPPEPISLEGPWGIRLEPTMDNRWGDFRYPASDEFLGPEARRFGYMEHGVREGMELGWHEPDIDDSDWENVTYSYGPYWWMIGPFEEGAEPEEILRVPGPGGTDLNGVYEDKGGEVQWHRYSYSRQFGYEGVGIPRELNVCRRISLSSKVWKVSKAPHASCSPTSIPPTKRTTSSTLGERPNSTGRPGSTATRSSQFPHRNQRPGQGSVSEKASPPSC